MKQAVYQAEKHRASSCNFADFVARTCTLEYRKTVAALNAQGANLSYKQTVFAAIVMTIATPEKPSTTADAAQEHLVNTSGPANAKRVKLCSEGKGPQRAQHQTPASVLNISECVVVGCGVGTKFCMAPYQQTSQFRDCHAEVLARRAFQHFVWTELLRSLDDGKLTKHRSRKPIFKYCSSNGTFSLRPDVYFHLYTTSTPCGNATIKRWGKTQPTPKFSGLTEHQIPIAEVRRRDPVLFIFIPLTDVLCAMQAHARYQFCGIPGGEIRWLFKDTRPRKKGNAKRAKSRNWAVPAGCATLTDLEVSYQSGLEPESQAALEDSSKSQLPRPRRVSTCSAKIAKWNALGLQGRLMAEFLVRYPCFRLQSILLIVSSTRLFMRLGIRTHLFYHNDYWTEV